MTKLSLQKWIFTFVSLFIFSPIVLIVSPPVAQAQPAILQLAASGLNRATDDGSAIVWSISQQLAIQDLPEELTLTGHTGYVNSAAYSPDGAHIVTASADGTAIVWDATTGEALLQLEGHRNYVFGAIYSPDGTRIVTTSADGTAIIWNATTGEMIQRLTGHTNLVYRAAYSPDGNQIATVSADRTAIIWDTNTGEPLLQLAESESENETRNHFIDIAYSFDGAQIITVYSDGKPIIWNATTGERLLYLFEDIPLFSHGVMYSPDGAHLLTASLEYTQGLSSEELAVISDAANGQILVRLRGHTDRVTTAAYSPDGRYIVTASADGTAMIWDAETGVSLYILQGHTDWVSGAVYSPDGTHVVTASLDGTAKVWQITEGGGIATSPDIDTSSTIATPATIPDGAECHTVRQDNGDGTFTEREECTPLVPTGETGRVILVVDGDTIDVDINGQTVRVRYLGMNAAETTEPCFDEGKQANAALVTNQTVTLIPDIEDQDPFGRLLRYVYVGDVFVNAELIQQGWAEAVMYEPNRAHWEDFVAMEQEAARNGLGCHGISDVFNDGRFDR